MKKVALTLIGAASVVSVAVPLDEERLAHLAQVALVAPKLANFMKRAAVEPQAVVSELRELPIAQIMPVLEAVSPATPRAEAIDAPIVVLHGMGDSCFNAGMKHLTEVAGTHAGVYSVCVPGGPNDIEDTLSGFLVTMDKNVDIFAEKVRADKNLASGFNAIGLSQGNSVIRGYIERYNDPPVKNVLHIHGTVMGVSGFPNCNPSGFLSSICDVIDEALGDLAYTEVIQNTLFQANYFRDPSRMNDALYLNNSQIAGWNNENPLRSNASYTENFGKVNSLNMIKALKDSMVYPNEGEWWGEFQPGQFKTVLKMKDSPLYNKFGLDALDAANKIQFATTPGDHLDFTNDDLTGWIDQYF